MEIDHVQRPFIKGREDPNWCGPATLVHIAGIFGIQATQRELAKHIYDPAWGTSGQDMIRGCRILRLHALWVKDIPPKELAALKPLGYEIILNYMDEDNAGDQLAPNERTIQREKIRNGGHYGALRFYGAIACLGLIDACIVIDDPDNEGRVSIFQEKTFVKHRWYDLDEYGKKLWHWALIVQKPKRVSTKGGTYNSKST